MALGNDSHSEGYQTIAAGQAQHTQGRFNIIDPKYNVSNNGEYGQYAHIVGNGTSHTARSNAHTLDWAGNAEFAGDVIAGGCNGKNPISLTKTFNNLFDLEASVTKYFTIEKEEITITSWSEEAKIELAKADYDILCNSNNIDSIILTTQSQSAELVFTSENSSFWAYEGTINSATYCFCLSKKESCFNIVCNSWPDGSRDTGSILIQFHNEIKKIKKDILPKSYLIDISQEPTVKLGDEIINAYLHNQNIIVYDNSSAENSRSYLINYVVFPKSGGSQVSIAYTHETDGFSLLTFPCSPNEGTQGILDYV